MNQLTIFRMFIWASVILALMGAFIDMVIPGLLPDTFELASRSAEASEDTMGIPMFMFLLILLITGLVGLVALFRLKPWARSFNLVITIVAVLITPLIGPTIQSGMATALLDTSGMLWGATLAMAYFSEVKQYFGRGEHSRQVE